MFRACAVSAMLWCARASEVELSALGAALADDDQCEAGADCALKALQLKAVKDTQGIPTECTEGMVGMIRGMAPGCLDTCSDMCGTLGDAVTAFLTKGADQTAIDVVKPIVCGAKDKFACAFENMGKCGVLITQAAALGIDLPPNSSAMDEQCSTINMLETKVIETKATSEVANIQNGTRTSSLCTEGMVGQIRNYGKSCIDSCPQMCGPMGESIIAFMTKGGYPQVKPIVCANRKAFGCALTGANLHKCSPLIKKAHTFGFSLPNSYNALNRQCR